ncbi:MAG: ABC transporter ATP-binding protein [Phycisphaeraceae bacterium]
MEGESNTSLAVDARDLRILRGGQAILDGVSCRIERGTCAAILGPNGCGKTTFARALTGQIFASCGEVSVLGETLGRTDVRALRRRIGLVNPLCDQGQGHVPGAVVDGELTAREAVVTGFFGTIGLYDRPTAAQFDRADAVLRQVGLSHRRELRFGLLSTGEQRRAMIARALVHMPELLILDEPTTGLDIPGREQVLACVELVLSQPDPPAVLMITHHVEELSPRTRQVMMMRGGRFIAAGPPCQVVTPEMLSETYGCKVYVRRLHGRYWLEVLPEAWLDLVDARPAEVGAGEEVQGS